MLKVLGHRLRPLSSQLQQAHADAVVIAEENLTMLPAIKTFTREPLESARYRRQSVWIMSVSNDERPMYVAMGPSVQFLAAAAMIELAKNSFLLDIDEQEMLALHFDELCRLANLPIYLDYPRCYEDLPRVRAEIMRHTSEQERKML